MKEKLFGVIPPITTPIDENEHVDERALRMLIRSCIDNGIIINTVQLHYFHLDSVQLHFCSACFFCFFCSRSWRKKSESMAEHSSFNTS